MDPVEALRRLGGVAAYGELIGPTTRGALAAAVRAGRVRRLRFDRYALVDTDEQVCRAVSVGGVVSHLSAAIHYGWKVKEPPALLCVTLPRNARKPSGELELRWRDLDDSAVYRHVTTRAQTVIDCARAYDFDVALSVADSALREGVLTRTDLMAAAERAPRTGRGRAIRVAETATGKPANPFESCLLAIALEVPGLSVVPQGHVRGVGWVDLLDRALGIVVEAESFEHHGLRSGLRRDVCRYTDCARLGLVVVRFTWEEVMFDPDRVRTALTDVVLWRTRQAVGRHGLPA